MLFGQPEEDLEPLLRLLEDDTQIRLGGYKKGQERNDVEVREWALMAAGKMMGRKLQDFGTKGVTGYCSIKRFTSVQVLPKPERWAEI